MKLTSLALVCLVLLVCFDLSTSEVRKRWRKRNKSKQQQNKKLEQTTVAVMETTAASEKEADLFDLSKEPGDIRDLVDMILEEDESGDGLSNSGNARTDPENTKVTIYEEELEFEKIVLEANVTRMRDSNRSPGSPSGTKKQRILICEKSYLEYHIFDLIASKQLPQEAVFPSWNRKSTLREKIFFLNQTLISHNLTPLPNCNLELLDLNLTPQRLEFFKLTQSPSSTTQINEANDKENKIEDLGRGDDEESSHTFTTIRTAIDPSIEEKLKRKKQLVGLINDGYLPPDTIIMLKRGVIDEEWIRRNVSQNPEFILSKLPEPIRDLILAGDMPKDIEDAIFSGNYNETELRKLLFNDDEVIKLLLPKTIVEMLQDRPVPEQLKIILISGKNESEMREEITNDTELMQEMMSPSMYFFYNLFQVQRNKDINVAISVVLMVILTCVMMSLGCTMTLSQIGEHAKKPKGVIIALFAQFIIMPAAAFGLTQAFDLETFAAMAVLICGCCPGGNLSNMLAYALSGDMNLSILMTTCSSVVGLGLMPLNIFIYSRFIVPVDSGQVVPFDKIVLNIAFTIIPVAIGIGIRHYKPTWVRNVMRAGAIVLGIGSVLIAVLAGVMFGDAFFIYFPTKVLACCAILPMTGYIFGYMFAWIARENPRCRRTICVETGCQNVQLCSTVLKLAFNPIVVGVLFLMPLVYMCFQVVEAVLIIFIFRLRNRCTGKKELVEEDSEEKKKSDVESNDDDKKSSENETKGLLQTNPENNEDSLEKANDKEAFEMNGKATADAIVESFKAAGTEHLF